MAEKTDDTLSMSLEDMSSQRPRYWSFENNARRKFCHNYFQYPAMMVPEMLGELIRTVTETDPNINTVFDPFVGSGTVLTETMLLGRDFVGQDINPLAILLCKAKSGPFRHDYLVRICRELKHQIEKDNSSRIDVDFPNRDKWFEREVSTELARIRRAVLQVEHLWCRRFLWVAVAETVRLTSNSRTSTFKLHTRTFEDISSRVVSPVRTFQQVIERNLRSLREFREALDVRGVLSRGCYMRSVTAKLRNAVSTSGRPQRLCDLLVTSPPYGDNTTTVPYGQHSYLPLQWIDLNDIDDDIDTSCLTSPYDIDRRSLGGMRKNALKDAEEAIDLAPSFKRFLQSIRSEPTDRKTRAAAYIKDLNACIDPILRRLRTNAYMVWVVGNRRIGGRLVPTDSVLQELMIARGARLVAEISRDIPTKRMANKNNVSSTMSKEQILVFRHIGER
jgi:hypothetical protein